MEFPEIKPVNIIRKQLIFKKKKKLEIELPTEIYRKKDHNFIIQTVHINLIKSWLGLIFQRFVSNISQCSFLVNDF